MRRLLPLLLALLLAAGADVLLAQQPSPLDASLRLALRLSAIGASPAPMAARAGDGSADPALAAPVSRLPALAALDGAAEGPFVRVLARVDGDLAAAALRQSGALVGARAGGVVTARIPLSRLDEAAAVPGVRLLQAASWLEPAPLGGQSSSRVGPSSRFRLGLVPPAASDVAAEETGVELLRQRAGHEFTGLAGQGVLIGVYDTGIDLEHADFLDGAGRTRVLLAWDQSDSTGAAPGAVGPHTFDYGRECDAAAIDAGACPLVDRIGHGTHVAGIAAGDGSATGNGRPAFRYVGAAPAADLIVVKGGDAGYTSDRVVDGVAYIFARAAELGRPVVVNLSLGTQAGPHDGTTLLEQALDSLAGPGRLIVAVAGNQGANANEVPAFLRIPLHASGELGLGATGLHTVTVPEYVPQPGVVDDGAVLELWYDGADSLAVDVVAPCGARVRAVAGDTATVLSPCGSAFIDNASGGRDPHNGDRQAQIAIFDADPDAPPAAGEWRVEVEDLAGPGGEYHLWLVGTTLGTPANPARLGGGTSNSHLVQSPGSANRSITAAAYASRHRWPGEGGEPVSFPIVEPLGDIAFFSGAGPTRDGRLKPEIAAPGKMVVAAAPTDAQLFRDTPWLREADGVHAAMLGTSMAAPQVAGVLALLLQREPTLTPEQARQLLTSSARRDAFTAHPHTGEPDGEPNAQWGWGKLDAVAAVTALGSSKGYDTAVRRPSAEERVNISANPIRGGQLVVNWEGPAGEVAVYTLSGRRVWRAVGDLLGAGRAVWALTDAAGEAVADGVYLLVVDLGDARVLRKLLVARR